MDDLTPREQQVLGLLKSGGGRRSLDELVAAITTDEKPVRRQGVVQTIKYMNSKLAQKGTLIVRESGGRGRGNKATYYLQKLEKRK